MKIWTLKKRINILTLMAKLYNESLPEQVKPTGPSKETIKFLLNFSKSLHITKYNKMTFEASKN